jgi:hypothetical protein
MPLLSNDNSDTNAGAGIREGSSIKQLARAWYVSR